MSAAIQNTSAVQNLGAVKNSAAVQNLARYVGIPFKARGREFDGADCYGLVALFHREEYGLDLTDPSGAYWGAAGDDARAGVFADAPHFGWVEIARKHVGFGDVLVFRVKGHPVHCGVAIDGRRMLHVLEGIDSVIEDYAGPHWGPRFHQAYRRAERAFPC